MICNHVPREPGRAVKGSIVFGALLLFAYGIGNGLPLLVVGTAAGEATKRLAGRTE